MLRIYLEKYEIFQTSAMPVILFNISIFYIRTRQTLPPTPPLSPPPLTLIPTSTLQTLTLPPPIQTSINVIFDQLGPWLWTKGDQLSTIPPQ